MSNELSGAERSLIDAYWRAANYLSVGQIYLYDNPLLKEPLSKEHIKPRLLGHWGTTPGLNFIYAHLNRVINKYDLDMSAPTIGIVSSAKPAPTSRSVQQRRQPRSLYGRDGDHCRIA